MEPTPSNSADPTTEAPVVAETPETTEVSSVSTEPTSTPEPVATTETPAATPAQAFVSAGEPTAATPTENPGQGLGIGSLVTALIGLHIVGLILGIVGLKKSKKAGYGNGLALAGIIISGVGMVLFLVYVVIFLPALFAFS